MATPYNNNSIQADTDRTRLQSFHEQSISVMNAMMSREWNKEEEEEGEVERKGGSMLGAIFILMNAIMGASILILPCSFGHIGIITAVIMELFVVFIGYISHMILAGAVDRFDGANYQDLMGKVCGPTAQLLSQLGLILYFFTLSCASHITMGDQAVKICELADGIVDSSEGEHWYCNRRFLIPLGSMTLIFPLIWVRNISTFSYVSVFSVFSVFYIVAAIIIDYYKLHLPLEDEILMPDVGILPIMQYLPVFTLGFQCHMTSVPLYYELHKRSVSRYTVVILVTSFLVFICYVLAAVFGLMTFGVDVDPDILLEYSSKDILMTIARAAISVSVIGSYPIFTFLGRGAVDDTLIQISEKLNRSLERNSEFRRVLVLLVWHFLALGVALLTSSLGTVLQLVGSIASLFMLFFPGYMLWRESRGGNWGYRVTGAVFMFLGLFTFVWTIVSTLYKVATHSS